MNHILLQFRTKFLSRSLWPDAHKWANTQDLLKKIMSENQIELVDFPTVITDENVRQVKQQLLSIYKLVYHKARLEQRILEHK